MCIEKSLGVEVCVAQANALIQLYISANIPHEQQNAIVYGTEFAIIPRYRQVVIDGNHVELTRKEFDLLHCLASYPGRVFTFNQLYNYVWHEEAAVVVDEIVRLQIKRLRRKLALMGKNYIQNEWGVGYKFVLSTCQS